MSLTGLGEFLFHFRGGEALKSLIYGVLQQDSCLQRAFWFLCEKCLLRKERCQQGGSLEGCGLPWSPSNGEEGSRNGYKCSMELKASKVGCELQSTEKNQGPSWIFGCGWVWSHEEVLGNRMNRFILDTVFEVSVMGYTVPIKKRFWRLSFQDIWMGLCWEIGSLQMSWNEHTVTLW